MPAPRILAIADTSVGDIVLNQILYKLLLQAYGPQAAIDVVAPPWAEALLRRMPQVRQHLPLPAGNGQPGLLGRWLFGRRLRGQYDQAIVIPRTSRSAMVAWFSGIGRRIGFERRRRLWLINDPRTHPFNVSEKMASLAPPELALPDSLPRPNLACDPDNIRELAKRFDFSADGAVGFVPGATGDPARNPAKRWPVSSYAALTEMLTREGRQVCILGTHQENPLGEALLDAAPHRVVNLCGKTSLDEAIDLIAGLDCLVSNDSGLMHVAAAVDTPVVGIYGATSPESHPPLTDRMAVCSTYKLCSPCRQHSCPYGHHACMTDLRPEAVHEALEQILAI